MQAAWSSVFCLLNTRLVPLCTSRPSYAGNWLPICVQNEAGCPCCHDADTILTFCILRASFCCAAIRNPHTALANSLMLGVCMSLGLPVCRSACRSICLSVCPFVGRSVCLSVCLPKHLLPCARSTFNACKTFVYLLTLTLSTRCQTQYQFHSQLYFTCIYLGSFMPSSTRKSKQMADSELQTVFLDIRSGFVSKRRGNLDDSFSYVTNATRYPG